MPEAAIDHAQQAGDSDRVVRLVLSVANRVWAEGRLDTVLRWMEWCSNNDVVEHHPEIAVHGALIYALTGNAAAAERWAAAAERSTQQGTLSDGNTLEGTLAYLRTLLCRDGLDQMRGDAQQALLGLHPASPYRPAMLHAEGVASMFEGDLDHADELFARAYEEATAGRVVPFVPIVIAERGLIAIERGDWPRAERLADEALRILDDGDFDDYWTSALPYAWIARVSAHRSDVDRARDLVLRAARLRPLLSYALPVISVQALMELARAYIALTDLGGALAALRQIHDIQQFRQELGPIMQEVDNLRSQLDVLKGEMLGASSLTTAELRVLPLLATHLSLTDISERLYVSRNTIKTHTVSIYRKLGVSTRNETIKLMVEAGLVAHT